MSPNGEYPSAPMESGSEALIEAIRQASTQGQLPCKKARELAEGCGVSLSEIGRVANKLKIKIVECELGCF